MLVQGALHVRALMRTVLSSLRGEHVMWGLLCRGEDLLAVQQDAAGCLYLQWCHDSGAPQRCLPAGLLTQRPGGIHPLFRHRSSTVIHLISGHA